LPGDADSLAFMHAGGDFDIDGLLLQLPAGAATARTVIANHRSAPAAVGAGGNHPKHSAKTLLGDAALPSALRADGWAAAGLGAGALAFFAAVLLFEFDGFFDSRRHLRQGELDLRLQIESARLTGAPSR